MIAHCAEGTPVALGTILPANVATNAAVAEGAPVDAQGPNKNMLRKGTRGKHASAGSSASVGGF